MADPRFQVFVSSTFRDLVEERREVTEQLLRMRCIPAGMELFTASSQPPWNLIEALLDTTDYVVLILAGRYGEIKPGFDGRSYTEREYDYAMELGLDVIPFLHEDVSGLPSKSVDSGAKDKKRKAFWEKVKDAHTIQTWSDARDLAQKVSTSIPEAIRTSPRPGWIRGDSHSTGTGKIASKAQGELKPSEPELNVSVQSHTEYPLATVRNHGAQIDEIVEKSTNDLLDGLPRTKPPASKFNAGARLGISGISAFADVFNSVNLAAAALTQPESRTEEQFRAEVTNYGKRLRLGLRTALDQVASQRLAPLTFRLRNNTRRNYENCRLQVHVAGAVRSVTVEENIADTPHLPNPPRKWGPYTRPAYLDIAPLYSTPATPRLFPGVVIENGGSVTLQYREVHLSPEDTVDLEPIVLILPDSENRVVRAGWKLTATNVDDLATGVLELSFDAAPVNLWSILEERINLILARD